MKFIMHQCKWRTFRHFTFLFGKGKKFAYLRWLFTRSRSAGCPFMTLLAILQAIYSDLRLNLIILHGFLYFFFYFQQRSFLNFPKLLNFSSFWKQISCFESSLNLRNVIFCTFCFVLFSLKSDKVKWICWSKDQLKCTKTRTTIESYLTWFIVNTLRYLSDEISY